MWHVIDGNDNSTCITHEKNILQAGTELHVGDKVTFFYNGKKCSGAIVFSDRDHAKCNAEMNKHVKMVGNMGGNKQKHSETVLPSKRTRNQTPFYVGPNASSASVPAKKKQKTEGPPMTEAEKTRQRILSLNMKEAAKHKNRALLNQVLPKPKRNDDDDDWNPNEDDLSQDSLVNMNIHNATLKGDQSALIQQLNRSRSPSPNNNKFSDGDRISWDKGDDREMLLKEIEELKKKLSEKEKSVVNPMAKGTFDEDKREDGNTKGCRKLFVKDDDLGAGEKIAKDAEEGSHDQDLEDIDCAGNKRKSKDSKKGGIEEDSDERESRKETGMGTNEGGDSEDQEIVEANSSFSQKNDMLVDELLGMDDSGKVNVDQVRDETLEYQLYGKRDDTVELGRKIFVKRDVLTRALVNVNAVRIVIRRLMQGVFIPSKITNCTVTGQPWRPGSKDKSAQENPKPLHQGALKAIVDFANGVAKKKKWKCLPFKDATSVLSGKLIEIKNHVKRGTLAD